MEIRTKTDYDRAILRIRNLEGIIERYRCKNFTKEVILPVTRTISEIQREIDRWKQNGGEGGY